MVIIVMIIVPNPTAQPFCSTKDRKVKFVAIPENTVTGLSFCWGKQSSSSLTHVNVMAKIEKKRR